MDLFAQPMTLDLGKIQTHFMEINRGVKGIWGGGRKICAIGLSVSRWVTYHGLALNVESRALPGFSHIIPCGIEEREVTSVECELTRFGANKRSATSMVSGSDIVGDLEVQATVPYAKKVLQRAFEEVFGPLGMIAERGKAKLSRHAVL